MRIYGKLPLFLCLTIFAFAAAAQSPKPPGPVLSECGLGEPNPDPAFANHPSAAVRAYKCELTSLLLDSQSASDAGRVREDLRSLQLSGSFRTAAVQLNPGAGLLGNGSAFAEVASQLDQTRPDKQTAAPASAAGTTSLVTKAAASSVLAFAIDAGALTQSTNGSTSTVSGTLEGIGSLLLGKSPISSAVEENWLRKVTGNIEVSASFSLAQPASNTTTVSQSSGGATPPAGTPVAIPSSVGKLSGITAQYVIHNPFNPRSQTFLKNWSASVSTVEGAAKTVLQAANPAELALNCAACNKDWDNAAPLLTAAAQRQDPSALATAFAQYVDHATADARATDKNFDADVASAVSAIDNYRQVASQAVDDALGNLFTLQYAYAKPQNQPETHDFKLIYGYALSGDSGVATAGSGAKSLFSANVDISLYGGSIPAGAKYGRLHYGQVSAEFDRPFAVNGTSKQATFSLAGYWQYQPDPSVLTITQSNVAPGTTIDAPTQVLVGTAGSLWVTQAKVTIGNGKSGICVPIGVKWSNKTDLLSGNKVGAQVGISYDFSSLTSLFGGGSQ